MQHDRLWRPSDPLTLDMTFFSKPLNMTSKEDRKWNKHVTCEDKEKLYTTLASHKELPWHLQWSLCKGDIKKVRAMTMKHFKMQSNSTIV